MSGATKRDPDEIYDEIVATYNTVDYSAPDWRERSAATLDREAALWRELAEAVLESAPRWAYAAARAAGDAARDEARQLRRTAEILGGAA